MQKFSVCLLTYCCNISTAGVACVFVSYWLVQPNVTFWNVLLCSKYWKK